MNELEQKIGKFFDDQSRNRDINLRDPILRYEQEMRQRTVMELLAPSPRELILDIGCGNARDLISFACKGATCVGVDFSNGMIKEGKKAIDNHRPKSVELILASATHLPFKENTFDKISCSEVIEHIPDYQKAVGEANRVLKEGGKFVITTPNRHSLYGVISNVLPMAFRTAGILLRTAKLRKGSDRTSRHPYDEWKTQKEVIKVIEENGFILHEKLGVCFIPSQLTYLLPKSLKIVVVRISSIFENRIRHLLTARGYGVAISALKRVRTRKL